MKTNFADISITIAHVRNLFLIYCVGALLIGVIAALGIIIFLNPVELVPFGGGVVLAIVVRRLDDLIAWFRSVLAPNSRIPYRRQVIDT